MTDVNESDAKPDAIPALSRGCRALVAEDDTQMRELVVGLLEMDGFSVTQAKSGDEMIQVLQRQSFAEFPGEPFDIIVTDLRMPGASGLEVLSRLRIVGCAIPAILLTAFPDETVRREAGLLNSMVLAKPFALESLRYAVHFYTNLSRRRSASNSGSKDTES